MLLSHFCFITHHDVLPHPHSNTQIPPTGATPDVRPSWKRRPREKLHNTHTRARVPREAGEAV